MPELVDSAKFHQIWSNIRNRNKTFVSYFTSPNRDKSGGHWQPCYPQMVVTANEHFSGTPVNLSHSSVHVPTDVFDGEEAVINAIDWSRKLEDTFQDNYKRDPGLSWQYFGSSTGFLRQVN